MLKCTKLKPFENFSFDTLLLMKIFPIYGILLLLLPSLLTRKVQYLQYTFDITTEQSLMYMELIDAKIWISKYALLCRVFANQVTSNSTFGLHNGFYGELDNMKLVTS